MNVYKGYLPNIGLHNKKRKSNFQYVFVLRKSLFPLCVIELKIIFVTTYIHLYTPNNNLSTIKEHFKTHINLGSII